METRTFSSRTRLDEDIEFPVDCCSKTQEILEQQALPRSLRSLVVVGEVFSTHRKYIFHENK